MSMLKELRQNKLYRNTAAGDKTQDKIVEIDILQEIVIAHYFRSTF